MKKEKREQNYTKNDQRITNNYEVIVIGGGHAGCEASLAAARLGLKTLLVTLDLGKIALMPCNPSIGGIGKGHLVREIDALGGEMGKNIDASKIQIKTLNSSKGPAVRALRAQADKRLYESRMRQVMFSQKNLDIREGLAEQISTSGNEADGVILSTGEFFQGQAVIVTAGTFLNARVVIGENSWPAGRIGEPPSKKLSSSLRKLGIKTQRFQTATPPRVDGRTVNYEDLEIQPGEKGLSFSLDGDTKNIKDVPCYLSYTNESTIRAVKKHMKHSPIKTGALESHGPRYCPSIDRKVINFEGKARHPVFIEPEGVFTNEMYLQGLTTAMPAWAQPLIIRTVKGLENARIVRYGYAVEYDYVSPEQLRPTLETKCCPNLYLAGQVIGTTGYEEAAALGLMSGINAVLKIKGKNEMVLKRSEAYIGVLIDDLVTKGVDEPYRMFTSRAEYRLVLRSDNAHARLSPLGYKLGLVSKKDYTSVLEKEKAVKFLIEKLRKIKLSPAEASEVLKKHHQPKAGRPMTAAEAISRPHVLAADFLKLEEPQEIINDAETYLKYGGYIKRQEADISRSIRLENTPVPDDFDYPGLSSLSFEAREKLKKIRPVTLGQASRIPGITPADISVMTVYLKQRDNGR